MDQFQELAHQDEANPAVGATNPIANPMAEFVREAVHEAAKEAMTRPKPNTASGL